MTLKQMADEVSAINKRKRDFIVDSRNLLMNVYGDIGVDSGERFSMTPTPVMHSQIAEGLNIPAKYYSRMMEETRGLLSLNVNHWLKSCPKRRMVRTLSPVSGNMQFVGRAYLSDRYRPLDNYDLMNVVIPKMIDSQMQIRSSNLSETHLFIHAVFPQMEAEVSVGDVVRAGVQIRNSEVGLSSVSIMPWVERLVCSNGMVVADRGIRKYHCGRKQVDGTYELFSDKTKKKSDEAFWMQVCDVIDSLMDKKKFDRIVESYRAAKGIDIGEPRDAVEVTKKYGVFDSEAGDVMKFLCEGGDMNLWGLANAVTQKAHTAETYDRAVELEEIGGRLIHASKKLFEAGVN